MALSTRSRSNWMLGATTLSLLALHGLVDMAQAQMPSVVYPTGAGGVTEAASHNSSNGAYVFDAAINGTPTQMLFDTGASVVALRAEDAQAMGIDVNALTYSYTVQTANGTTQAAPVTIDTLTVGGITRHKVAAMVSRPGVLRNNLMGQTFLTRLAGYHRDGDHIVLRGE